MDNVGAFLEDVGLSEKRTAVRLIVPSLAGDGDTHSLLFDPLLIDSIIDSLLLARLSYNMTEND